MIIEFNSFQIQYSQTENLQNLLYLEHVNIIILHCKSHATRLHLQSNATESLV